MQDDAGTKSRLKMRAPPNSHHTPAYLLAAISIIGTIAGCHTAAAQGAAPSKQKSVAGVTVEARLTPLRMFGFGPVVGVRFEQTIVVAPSVKAFSGIEYECLFVDAQGAATGVASRGIASRDAFTAMPDGRLVSTAHEELPDIGKVGIACRATKIEK